MGKILEIFEAVKGHLKPWSRLLPITTFVEYTNFLATRSAFVGQKTLYGYVKTRMGMKYPQMFEDDVFIDSINIAKWQVYAACISDLAIFMAAQIYSRSNNPDLAKSIAIESFNTVIKERFSNEEFSGNYHSFIEEFANRVALIDFKNVMEAESAFQLSPQALIDWAPIDENLKKLDREIVVNSIRFQWQRVRRDLRQAIRIDDVISNWQGADNS